MERGTLVGELGYRRGEGRCAAGIAVGLSQVSIILVKMSAGPNGLYSKQADGTRGYLL